MKRLVGLAVFGLFLIAPARAQSRIPFGAGSNYAPPMNGGGSGSGGSGFGSSIGGDTSGSRPPHVTTQFDGKAVSGTEADFVPSAFLSFDQAVKAGRAVLDRENKSLVQAAEENTNSEKPRAKFALVQDANGNAILESR
jgi:hypothetical protein